MSQLSEKILYCSPEFHEVPADNEYNDLNRAIASIAAWDKVTIKLMGDFPDQEMLTLPEDNIQVSIDGGFQFSTDFRSGEQIVQMDAQKTLKFKNMNRLRGDILIVRGDSTLYLENILNTMLVLDIVDGKYVDVFLKNINLWSSERAPAINMYNADSKLYIYDSFVKGGERSPALFFNTDSEDKVKIKNSVILNHEVGGSPIQKRSGTNVSVRAYNCFGDAVLCSHDITNLIDEAHHNNLFNSGLNF